MLRQASCLATCAVIDLLSRPGTENLLHSSSKRVASHAPLSARSQLPLCDSSCKLAHGPSTILPMQGAFALTLRVQDAGDVASGLSCHHSTSLHNDALPADLHLASTFMCGGHPCVMYMQAHMGPEEGRGFDASNNRSNMDLTSQPLDATLAAAEGPHTATQHSVADLSGAPLHDAHSPLVAGMPAAFPWWFRPCKYWK